MESLKSVNENWIRDDDVGISMALWKSKTLLSIQRVFEGSYKYDEGTHGAMVVP
jgi:hypothetical protein